MTQATTRQQFCKTPIGIGATLLLAGANALAIEEPMYEVVKTYRFCAPELAKEIPGRIDPERDQHAAHELIRRGNAVCPRQGAAVDFIVEDKSMLEVAQWIVTNTPFDRLYFYGDDRAIHVSFGPDHSRQVVRMVACDPSKLVPRANFPRSVPGALVTGSQQRRFVVQEHYPRTQHYDFRLEKDGVFTELGSAKTHPQTAGVRRLAIAVEGHDLSFGDFGGEILRVSTAPERSRL